MKHFDKLKYIALGGLLAAIGFFVGNFNNMSADEHVRRTVATGSLFTNENDVDSELYNYAGVFASDPIPSNYIANGNFFSQKKPRQLIVDTSFIDKVDTAIYWYDKVLNEFPGTQEANEALKAKIRTLIGWEEGYGKDKKIYGLKSRVHTGYFPLIESTFLELETGFPDDEYLEAFAFQIAQLYFIHVLGYRHYRYKESCITWFEKTIKLAKGADTFYSHLARKRIKSVKGLRTQ